MEQSFANFLGEPLSQVFSYKKWTLRTNNEAQTSEIPQEPVTPQIFSIQTPQIPHIPQSPPPYGPKVPQNPQNFQEPPPDYYTAINGEPPTDLHA